MLRRSCLNGPAAPWPRGMGDLRIGELEVLNLAKFVQLDHLVIVQFLRSALPNGWETEAFRVTEFHSGRFLRTV